MAFSSAYMQTKYIKISWGDFGFTIFAALAVMVACLVFLK
jgi:multidrug efflux pump subunit AcrB